MTESAVANKVTATPRLTSPSVNKEANCSQGPYPRGGTRQEIGARIATRKVIGLGRRLFCDLVEDPGVGLGEADAAAERDLRGK